ncbi:polysaccharide biosynthesis/export family protein [SAR92 clade bacterium H231]|nr:polysaccharide biosynthesis/export family protein [SAR92 clade bacterium H231]
MNSKWQSSRLCTLIALAGILLAGLANAAKADTYLLNPGDQLDISVWNEEALQKTIIVLPDGMISFPLVGHLRAAGRSAAAVEKAISDKLDSFIAEPEVNVTVTSTRGNVTYVVGKVLKPGPIVMVQNTNVMQALAIAGGINEFASGNAIKIIRSNGEEPIILKVRYSDLEKGSDLSSNHRLQAGDVIVVP